MSRELLTLLLPRRLPVEICWLIHSFCLDATVIRRLLFDDVPDSDDVHVSIDGGHSSAVGVYAGRGRGVGKGLRTRVSGMQGVVRMTDGDRRYFDTAFRHVEQALRTRMPKIAQADVQVQMYAHTDTSILTKTI